MVLDANTQFGNRDSHATTLTEWHFAEIHIPSAGKSGAVVLAILLALVLLYWWLKKKRGYCCRRGRRHSEPTLPVNVDRRNPNPIYQAPTLNLQLAGPPAPTAPPPPVPSTSSNKERDNSSREYATPYASSSGASQTYGFPLRGTEGNR